MKEKGKVSDCVGNEVMRLLNWTLDPERGHEGSVEETFLHVSVALRGLFLIEAERYFQDYYDKKVV
jgi:hypothetical protein